MNADKSKEKGAVCLLLNGVFQARNPHFFKQKNRAFQHLAFSFF